MSSLVIKWLAQWVIEMMRKQWKVKTISWKATAEINNVFGTEFERITQESRKIQRTSRADISKNEQTKREE